MRSYAVDFRHRRTMFAPAWLARDNKTESVDRYILASTACVGFARFSV